MKPNRWLASRWMVVGAVLCVATYVPAVWSENATLWVPVFQVIAMAYLAGGMGKNAVDEWGKTRRRQAGDESL